MFEDPTYIRRGHPLFFTTLAILSFVIAVMASALTSDFNQHDNSPSSEVNGSVRFLIFVGWWMFLFSITHLVLFYMEAGGAFTSIATYGFCLLFTWIFVLAGAGAISAGVHLAQHKSLLKIVHYNTLLTLMAFCWMAWIVLTVMVTIIVLIGISAIQDGRSLKEGLDETPTLHY